MPRFAADGLELAYATYGSGDAVVLLHGFTSLGATWSRLGWVDGLVEAGLRAVTLDLAGHGASDPPPDGDRCATPCLARDVLALLDELALERASLLGFSLGGSVALQVALDAPDRVRRLVVAGVGDAALDELHDPRDVAALGRNERIRRNAELAGNDWDALAPYLRQPGWPGGLARVGPLRPPTLLLAAGADEYMRGTDELVRRLRPTEVVPLPGLGHHDVLMSGLVRRQAIDFLAG